MFVNLVVKIFLVFIEWLYYDTPHEDWLWQSYGHCLLPCGADYVRNHVDNYINLYASFVRLYVHKKVT